jgi:hypothetical protein
MPGTKTTAGRSASGAPGEPQSKAGEVAAGAIGFRVAMPRSVYATTRVAMSSLCAVGL